MSSFSAKMSTSLLAILYVVHPRKYVRLPVAIEIVLFFPNLTRSKYPDGVDRIGDAPHTRTRLMLRRVRRQKRRVRATYITATIQVLKRAGRPSEHLVSHENCRFSKPTGHECVHIQKITEASGTEEAEADAEFDNALKEAIQGVQDAVMAINEHLEEVRYEIAALED
ncbi:uncharacterized protein LOC129876298 isoform X2 [Solanum dulcamara]|uniref:uncharacterized protein LOC129876298 isoform X2 n=1 Tax=Solanum dulcamara TaxID=45834 RepID=UPI0024865D2D|nr:uncharacterized protein LOC129876298 isoform X2 [Solanum dulcamara]